MTNVRELPLLKVNGFFWGLYLTSDFVDLCFTLQCVLCILFLCIFSVDLLMYHLI